MKSRCLICRGDADSNVCISCGEVLLALALCGDEQMTLTAQLLLSALRARNERKLLRS